jgi:hypothetical protein
MDGTVGDLGEVSLYSQISMQPQDGMCWYQHVSIDNISFLIHPMM